jgi:hypothetical protein
MVVQHLEGRGRKTEFEARLGYIEDLVSKRQRATMQHSPRALAKHVQSLTFDPQHVKQTKKTMAYLFLD